MKPGLTGFVTAVTGWRVRPWVSESSFVDFDFSFLYFCWRGWTLIRDEFKDHPDWWPPFTAFLRTLSARPIALFYDLDLLLFWFLFFCFWRFLHPHFFALCRRCCCYRVWQKLGKTLADGQPDEPDGKTRWEPVDGVLIGRSRPAGGQRKSKIKRK